MCANLANPHLILCKLLCSLERHSVSMLNTQSMIVSLYECVSGVAAATQGLQHHANTSVTIIPPYTPLLYSKTGVYRGTHNLCFEQKYEKITFLHRKITIFPDFKIYAYCIGMFA